LLKVFDRLLHLPKGEVGAAQVAQVLPLAAPFLTPRYQSIVPPNDTKPQDLLAPNIKIGSHHPPFSQTCAIIEEQRASSAQCRPLLAPEAWHARKAVMPRSSTDIHYTDTVPQKKTSSGSGRYSKDIGDPEGPEDQ
jgi:hypothetical protein